MLTQMTMGFYLSHLFVLYGVGGTGEWHLSAWGMGDMF